MNSQDLNYYLLRMIELNASDLYLRAAHPPAFRINGKIHSLNDPAPTDEQMKIWTRSVMTPLASERFEKTGDMDVAFLLEGKARYRINLFMASGRIGIVARLIPIETISFPNLNLPESILDMADATHGFVLVVGPTGCGKSTTLAAMIDHINRSRYAHIVTIEDPVEFYHTEKKSLIHHRHVGFDTETFASAIKHVVRQSPDVVLIGELRDADSIQSAFSAALTGHLILSTLHTTSVVQSVDRMLGYFPPESRKQAQLDFASTLVGIVSMRLLPRADGKGRVPALEILLGTPTVRRIIADGAFAQLYDIMKRSPERGMCTFNQSLLELCNHNLIEPDLALRISPNPEELRLNIQGMFTGIDSIDMRPLDEDDEDEKERLNG